MISPRQILFYLIVAPFICVAQLSLKEVKQSMESAFASKGRFVLEVQQYKKYLYETDTIKRDYSVYVDRTTKPNFISIYQNDYKRYIMYDTSDLAYSYDSLNNELKQITGSVQTLLKNEGSIPRFLNPTELDFVTFFFNDSVSRMVDSNNSDLTIRFVGHSNNGVKSGWIEMKIDRSSFLPFSMITFVELEDGEVQYETLSFKYDTTGISKHEEIRGRISKSQLNPKVIRDAIDQYFFVDSNFQSFPIISDGKQITIATDTSKFILLDFWYISCLPCIESIPQLNELVTRFPNRLKVYSINGIDKEKDIRKFASKQHLLTEYVRIEREILKKMHIKAFPTFVLIAPNNKIVYIQYGINTKLYEDVSKSINSYIRNKSQYPQ